MDFGQTGAPKNCGFRKGVGVCEYPWCNKTGSFTFALSPILEGG